MFCYQKRPRRLWVVVQTGHDILVFVKVKEVDLYCAFIVVPHTQGAQVQITQCYLQITPYLPLPRIIIIIIILL